MHLQIRNYGVVGGFGELSGSNGLPLIDKLLITLVLGKEFLFDFFGIGMYLNVAICVLVVVRIVLGKWKVPSHVAVFIFAICVWLALAVLQGGELSIAISNLARLVQVGIYAMYLSFLLQEFELALFNAYRKGCILFNVVLIANMGMMFLQYLHPGQYIAITTGTEFSGVDTICGFFGAGSTHAIALYTVFVVLYNIEHARNCGHSKIAMLLYTAFVTVLALAFSVIVDNKAFPLFCTLGLVFYLVIRIRAGKVLISRRIDVIVLIVAGAAIVFIFAPLYDSFIQKIGNYARVALAALNPSAYVSGSDERFQMITYSLIQPSSWAFGDGFGAAGIYQPQYRGYNHFGMSDYGSLVLLGGIWFYVLIVLVYVKGCITQVKLSSTVERSLFITMLLFVIACTIYTQVLTQVRIAVPMMLCLACFRFSLLDREHNQREEIRVQPETALPQLCR